MFLYNAPVLVIRLRLSSDFIALGGSFSICMLPCLSAMIFRSAFGCYTCFIQQWCFNTKTMKVWRSSIRFAIHFQSSITSWNSPKAYYCFTHESYMFGKFENCTEFLWNSYLLWLSNIFTNLWIVVESIGISSLKRITEICTWGLSQKSFWEGGPCLCRLHSDKTRL